MMAKEQLDPCWVYQVGERVLLAGVSSAMRFFDKNVSAKDRIPRREWALLAGRQGVVVSAVRWSRQVPFLRVSVLTKEGIVQCNDVPIKLMVKVVEKDAKVPKLNEASNRHELARKDVLVKLSESIGQMDIDKADREKKRHRFLNDLKQEILTETKFKNELQSKNMLSIKSPIRYQKDATSNFKALGEKYDAVVGDSEGNLDPLGICFYDGFTPFSSVLKSTEENEDGVSTASSPVDDSVERFSETIEQMIRESLKQSEEFRASYRHLRNHCLKNRIINRCRKQSHQSESSGKGLFLFQCVSEGDNDDSDLSLSSANDSNTEVKVDNLEGNSSFENPNIISCDGVGFRRHITKDPIVHLRFHPKEEDSSGNRLPPTRSNQSELDMFLEENDIFCAKDGDSSWVSVPAPSTRSMHQRPVRPFDPPKSKTQRHFTVKSRRVARPRNFNYSDKANPKFDQVI